MSSRRRLACVLAVPLAFYVYACSSDSTDDPTNPEEEGGTTNETGTPDKDGGSDLDSSTKKDSTATDASDGSVAITCVGNPLLGTPAAVTPDGGVDAGVSTRLVTAAQAAAFVDGPQWVDSQGGFLVYSIFAPDNNEAVRRVAIDGGGAAAFRTAGMNDELAPIGNAVKGGVVLTVGSPKNAGGTAQIFQTLASDGGVLPPIALPNNGLGDILNPNDIAVHPNGNFYFTDGQYIGGSNEPALYRVLNDAGVQQIDKNLPRPNGIALSADAKKLYVGLGPNDGEAGKAILVYDVNVDGTIVKSGTNPSTFIPGTALVDNPDGIAIDVGGNLWVAESAVDGSANGRVEIFAPNKTKLGTIPFGGSRPTGIAFGGADNKTVFISTEALSSGGLVAPGIFTFKSRCAGVR